MLKRVTMRRPTKNSRPAASPVRPRRRSTSETLDTKIAPEAGPAVGHNLPHGPLAETEAASAPTQAPSESKVMTIPEAGRALGYGRNASYDAARAGQIPTVPVGRRKKMVPRGWVDRMLEKLIDEALARSAPVGIALDSAVGTTGVSAALQMISGDSRKKK
jgi:hypothetical protein